MRGLSRWAGTGGSSRTVQRFFSTVLPGAMRCWVFCRQHLFGPEEVDLWAGDAVVVTKAGKTPPGLERFGSSLSGKPVPGLAFFTLALGRVQARRAFPIRVEHVGRSDAEQAASQATAAAQKPKAASVKRRPGRPQGSRNTPQAPVTLTPALVRLTALLDALLQLIARVGALTSLVLAGHVGNHTALPRARPAHWPLLATLRCDAALSLPSTGPSAGRGPRRK